MQAGAGDLAQPFDAVNGAENFSADRGQIGPDLLRSPLARMFTQRVGYFVAEYRSQLIIGNPQFFNQTGVHRNFAARHTPGIDFGCSNQVLFPLPVARVGPEYASLRNQPSRNAANPAQLRGIPVQRAFFARIGQHLCVLLACRLFYLRLRHRHSLRAANADCAALSGLNRAAGCQHQRRQQRAERPGNYTKLRVFHF